MERKKVYVIKSFPKGERGSIEHKFVTDNKEKAYELFELLSEGSFQRLNKLWNWGDPDDEDRYYYPKELQNVITVCTPDIYKDIDEATSSRDAFRKAAKMKLISKGKKKP